MAMKTTLILILASLAVWSAPALAGSISVEAKGSYFLPTEKAFKDIYGSGISYGAEIGIDFLGRLSLWVGGDYYRGEGKLTFTGEKTKIEIMPLWAGIRYAFSNSSIRPYVGIGVGYFQYKESNPIGKIDEGNLGLVAKLGLTARIAGMFFTDLQAEYTNCSVKPADLKADLGGIRAGIGLGITF